MKRIVALLLALLMLGVCIPSLAEEAPAPFVFRGSVNWDMTLGQVAEAEGRQPDETYDEEAYVMARYNGVQVSRFAGMLVYMFVDGGLKMAAYGLSDLEDADIEYLARAMSSTYGAYESTDAESAAALLEGVMGAPVETYQLDGLEAQYLWTLPNGTLVIGGKQYGIFGLFYVNPTWKAEEAPQQDTGYAFTFRGGIAWGMSPDQVLAIEGREPAEIEEAGRALEAYYSDVKISRYDGMLMYSYLDQELRCAVYMVNGAGSQGYTYLQQAMAQVYGEAKQGDRSGLIEAVNLYMPDAQWDEAYLTGRFDDWCQWTLEDGTAISMMRGGEDIVVAYVSPIVAAPALDLTGL